MIYVQLFVFVISLILASNLMLYKRGVSLWMIGSAGVWAGVWARLHLTTLLRRLWLQKQISTAQTLASNYVIYSRWQRLCWDALASLFYSVRKWRCVVHLFLQSMTHSLAPTGRGGAVWLVRSSLYTTKGSPALTVHWRHVKKLSILQKRYTFFLVFLKPWLFHTAVYTVKPVVTYIGRNSTLQVTRRGGQLKNQQPSKAPPPPQRKKRAFSSYYGTKECSVNVPKRHSFVSWLSKHPQRNIWILMCALFLICLWNINYLGKRGLISNRALTWNV